MPPTDPRLRNATEEMILEDYMAWRMSEELRNPGSERQRDWEENVAPNPTARQNWSDRMQYLIKAGLHRTRKEKISGSIRLKKIPKQGTIEDVQVQAGKNEEKQIHPRFSLNINLTGERHGREK